MARKKTKKDYIYAVGRRRSAVARARLFKGKKENLVNGQLIGEYFPGPVMRAFWQTPFNLTNTANKFYVTIKVIGGGKKGQLEATMQAIARALSALDPKKHRPVLKMAGLFTRNPRTRERRKVGMGGKARRKKQSPKR